MTTSEHNPAEAADNFPRPGHDPRSERARLNELADRLGAPEGAELDIAVFLAENWQRFLGGLVVVLLGVWIFSQYNAAETRKIGETSQRFSSMQSTFPKVMLSDGQVSESDRTAFSQTISALEKQASSAAYRDLASLYQAVDFWKKGDLASAKGILEQHGANTYSGGETKLSANILVQELASLLYSRLLLTENTDDGKTAAAARLKSLAINAHVINLEALIALFRISSTEQTRQAALETAKQLRASRPELAAMIEQELGAIGIRLE